jgi:hypothetical protein
MHSLKATKKRERTTKDSKGTKEIKMDIKKCSTFGPETSPQVCEFFMTFVFFVTASPD